MNKYTDYKNGEYCGLRFKAVYIDKTHSEFTSPAAELGKYFEYICTGATNRDGSIPEAPMTKTGLSADGKRANEQKKNFDRLYKYINYKSSITLEHTINGQNFKGVLDIMQEYKGNISAIRDIKYTGLINDKWSDFGWVNIKYTKHINQAKFYIWLYYQINKVILPFYFDVFSSKNEKEFKVIKVTMDESALIEFEISLFEGVNMLKFDIETGFIAYPDLMPCSTCPLKNECKEYTDLPKIEYINL